MAVNCVCVASLRSYERPLGNCKSKVEEYVVVEGKCEPVGLAGGRDSVYTPPVLRCTFRRSRWPTMGVTKILLTRCEPPS